ncbi:hypothetical protein MUK72_13115 [Halococcus dombrowskii]|uniref:Uncharacterized protein n=1 Tax=Halococcus dombrowskii TaxID=179637 RepID=A0AAX3AQU4_HALDO|nr:hypothetical protein [Halococcus dombrowskii]UOO94898.1 hypothetical protein MUK72_13115 [Halococcus dombrowskii]
MSSLLSRIGWAGVGLMTAGMVPFILETPAAAVAVSLLALGSFYIAVKGSDLQVIP